MKTSRLYQMTGDVWMGRELVLPMWRWPERSWQEETIQGELQHCHGGRQEQQQIQKWSDVRKGTEKAAELRGCHKQIWSLRCWRNEFLSANFCPFLTDQRKLSAVADRHIQRELSIDVHICIWCDMYTVHVGSALLWWLEMAKFIKVAGVNFVDCKIGSHKNRTYDSSFWTCTVETG